MKKILLSLAITSLVLGLAPAISLAQGDQRVEQEILKNLAPVEKVYNPVDDPQPGSLQTTIAKIIRQLLAFLGIVFILLVIYGGWKWMTSAGNESEVGAAKSIITAAVVGLAIVLVAYGVAQFVTERLLEATGAK